MHIPITLIIEKFAAFAIPGFIDFLDRARSTGIGVVIAHQDHADLKSISEEFQSRIVANTNTTIFSGVKNPSDAEHFAGLLGTRLTTKEIWQTEEGFFEDKSTGTKSINEVDEYVIRSNQIKQLKQGEILSVYRAIDPHFGSMWVPKTSDFNDFISPKEELVADFKSCKNAFLDSTKQTYKCRCSET